MGLDPQAVERLGAALADRYRIERELGAGGMATVYLAHDLKHDRKVAIKVLKPELAAVLGAERFVQEIRTTAALSHPHILPLFDSGEADGFLYYVMPYIEGETVREKLNRETQCGIEEAVRIATEVADALDYAHRHGVIHRDIKPENILLHDGRPMVMDFGIALAVSAAAGGRMTETGLSLGTPHYMSPEQATADKQITARSDVYSLGAVLYEMLTGEPPHTGSSAQAIIMKIVTDEARPMVELRKAVPPNVAAAVAKALEKLPADRFDGARALAHALHDPAYRHAVADVVGHAHRARGSDWRLPALTAAAAVVITATVMQVWSGRADDGSQSPAVFDLGFGDRVPLSDVMIAADGSALAYSAWLGPFTRRIYARRIDEMDFRQVESGDAIYPTVSPDGEWVAFVEIGVRGALFEASIRKIVRASVSSGESHTILESDSVGAFDPHWGTDGWIVFVDVLQGPTQGTYRVPASGGAPAERISRFTGRNPHMLPDGSGVLVNESEQTHVIHLVDLRSDSFPSRLIIPDGADPVYLTPGVIAYTRDDGGLYGVPFDLDHHEVTGPPFPLLADVASQQFAKGFSVSRTGMLVYTEGVAAFQSAARQQLILRDAAGRTDTIRGIRNPGHVALSPKGDRIAVSGRDSLGGLQIVDPRTSNVATVRVPGRTATSAVWSHDGARVAVLTQDSAGSQKVFIAGAGGSRELVELTVDLESPLPVAWPSDDRLVLQTRRGASQDLFIASPRGGAVIPYLTAPFNERSLSVSPDGKWAAYVSDEADGVPAVYVQSFPLPTDKHRVSPAGGDAPRWSPDGRNIYFWQSGAEGADNPIQGFGARVPVSRLYAVDVLLGATVVVGAPRLLFLGPFVPTSSGAAGRTIWGVSPDGRFLLVATHNVAPIDAPRRHRVIVNWFDDVKRRMAGK